MRTRTRYWRLRSPVSLAVELPTQRGCRSCDAATASLGALGIPVVGVVSTVLITGEKLSVADIIGFALIFAASASVLFAR
jgi:drug/metabolite transporter (DMT)-like permease